MRMGSRFLWRFLGRKIVPLIVEGLAKKEVVVA
jgi:hypothetical protein